TLPIPGIDPAGHLKSALEKLETSLSNFKLGLAEVDVDIDEPYFLAMLREAANVSKTVEITYFSFSTERITTREVDPYLLFEEAGKWYLRGYCHLAREVRHFSLGRILSCSVTQSTFQLPEDERIWTESGVSPRAFEGTGEWVLLSVPKKFRWLFERLVESPQLLAELEEFEVFGFYASSGRWLSSLLLRLGPDAVVIQPEKYRNLGRLAAAQILKLYKN
ncbi:MAG: WYL domain-containing protein, partial [Actinobacteria bacterium]|nr:WYL domain-containing protein [Actinomycetota bacterium]